MTTTAEARANIGHRAVWHTPGRDWPVRILYVLDQAHGYPDPPRVWVRLEPFMSERDVAPEELELT